jgi:hypothetical protein
MAVHFVRVNANDDPNSVLKEAMQNAWDSEDIVKIVRTPAAEITEYLDSGWACVTQEPEDAEA